MARQGDDVHGAFAAFAPGRVHFAGTQPHAAIASLLSTCDLFVWPAVDEVIGMVLLEAQACGVPVIAGRGPGVGAVVADGAGGLLVPAGDDAAFADCGRDAAWRRGPASRDGNAGAPLRARQSRPARRRRRARRDRRACGPPAQWRARAVIVAFLRHGRTAWNDAGRMQGRADVPLSEAGRTQVRRWRLPASLAGAQFVASPLARARETAALLGAQPVAVDDALIEMDWGEWEGETLRSAQVATRRRVRGDRRRAVSTSVRPAVRVPGTSSNADRCVARHGAPSHAEAGDRRDAPGRDPLRCWRSPPGGT